MFTSTTQFLVTISTELNIAKEDMVTLFAAVDGAVIGSDSIPGMLGVYFDFYTIINLAVIPLIIVEFPL